MEAQSQERGGTTPKREGLDGHSRSFFSFVTLFFHTLITESLFFGTARLLKSFVLNQDTIDAGEVVLFGFHRGFSFLGVSGLSAPGDDEQAENRCQYPHGSLLSGEKPLQISISRYEQIMNADIIDIIHPKLS